MTGIGRARWRVELARQRGGPPHQWLLEAPDAEARLALPARAGDRADRRAERRSPRDFGEGTTRAWGGPPPRAPSTAANGSSPKWRTRRSSRPWRPGARWAREAAVAKTGPAHADEGALVTAHRIGNRDLIAAACPRGARARPRARHGARQGAGAGRAGSTSAPADPEGDAAWLARLGLFAARRWTPRAALSGAGRAVAGPDRRRPSVRRRGG